jgi:hypothetical protein
MLITLIRIALVIIFITVLSFFLDTGIKYVLIMNNYNLSNENLERNFYDFWKLDLFSSFFFICLTSIIYIFFYYLFQNSRLFWLYKYFGIPLILLLILFQIIYSSNMGINGNFSMLINIIRIAFCSWLASYLILRIIASTNNR